MHPTLTIAKRAAYNAGTLITNALNSSIQELSEIDRLIAAVEATLIEEIKEAYPKDTIVTPNQTLGETNESDCSWLINPISGRTNLYKGFSLFSFSIAFIKEGKTEAALVYQPLNDELFIASKGDGARLNDKRIRATSQGRHSPIITTEAPLNTEQSSNQKAMTQHLLSLRNLFDDFSDIRQIGCDNLALCYTACGRFDGYFRLGVDSNSIKAAILIAEESGVIISDLEGSNKYPQTGNIIAGPAKIYKLLAKSLNKQ